MEVLIAAMITVSIMLVVCVRSYRYLARQYAFKCRAYDSLTRVHDENLKAYKATIDDLSSRLLEDQ